jgi:hypothetical protein
VEEEEEWWLHFPPENDDESKFQLRETRTVCVDTETGVFL